MSSIRRLVSIACVGLGLVAVCDCKRDRDRSSSATSTTTVTSAGVREILAADVERIATARCEWEAACRRGGPYGGHADPQTCMSLVRSEVANELTPEACPRATNADRVTECIAAVERSSCYDPVGALMRVEDCRLGKLCPRAPP